MCHARHHHRHAVSRHAEELRWRDRGMRASGEEPPRRDPGMRASDAERESVVSLLRKHGAEGRLDVDELEQRVGAAYAARTHGELAALLDDLPGTLPARPRSDASRRRQPRVGHEWAAFLKVSFVLIAIWALSGAGYFWPAWVLVCWAVPLALRSGPRLLRLR